MSRHSTASFLSIFVVGPSIFLRRRSSSFRFDQTGGRAGFFSFFLYWVSRTDDSGLVSFVLGFFFTEFLWLPTRRAAIQQITEYFCFRLRLRPPPVTRRLVFVSRFVLFCFVLARRHVRKTSMTSAKRRCGRRTQANDSLMHRLRDSLSVELIEK